MALNTVRGFRRIGLVLTFPLATLIVLAFYGNTKEFSPTNYEVQSLGIDFDILSNQIGNAFPPYTSYTGKSTNDVTTTPEDDSVAAFGKWVTREYPASYDDLSDLELGRRVRAKYPDAYSNFKTGIAHTLPPDFSERWEKQQNEASERTRIEVEVHSLAVDMPGKGTGYFSKDVPLNVVARVTADFIKRPALVDAHTDWFEQNAPKKWQFTVHKQVSKLRLAGLIAGSVLFPALFIQGSISILAWVFRGFKG